MEFIDVLPFCFPQVVQKQTLLGSCIGNISVKYY